MRLLLILLSSPEHKAKLQVDKKYIYYEELVKLNILSYVDNEWSLNIENLRKSSVVVSDELYENFLDINWLREQRKKLGIIQGRLKDEEFRAKQQARRKIRRAYTKEQKAKRLAQPPEELPLSQLIFSESKDIEQITKEQ